MRRLQGGSASTNKIAEYNSAGGSGGKGPYMQMFQDKDIRVEFPKEGQKGVIMPAFGDLNPEDEAYKTSVAPYRLAGVMDEARHTECFTAWYNQLKVYTFYGTSKCSFISCVEYVDNDGNHPWKWDPIMDVRNKIYRSVKDIEDSPLKHLVKSSKSRSDIVWLPRAKDAMLINVLCAPSYEKAKDKSVRVFPMVLGPMSAAKLLNDLDEGSRRSATKLVDENWPDYKLGDPTNPLRPLQFKGAAFPSDNGGSYTGLKFSDDADKFGSDVVVADKLTKAQLADRIDLMDIDNVLYIPTYEEQTDFLVEIKEIPYDLVREACEERYDGQFPAKPKATTVYNAPEEEEAPKSAGLAGKSYGEDDDDNIPYGDDEDDGQREAAGAPAPEKPADEEPIDAGTEDAISEALVDDTVNPDNLSAADWFTWASEKGLKNLSPKQLKLFVDMKRAGFHK